MTDITELAQSLQRRATSAKEFGESLYVKADDVLALIEALEKAMEAYWKTQCRGTTDDCEELQARIAEPGARTGAPRPVGVMSEKAFHCLETANVALLHCGRALHLCSASDPRTA